MEIFGGKNILFVKRIDQLKYFNWLHRSQVQKSGM